MTTHVTLLSIPLIELAFKSSFTLGNVHSRRNSWNWQFPCVKVKYDLFLVLPMERVILKRSSRLIVHICIISPARRASHNNLQQKK